MRPGQAGKTQDTSAMPICKTPQDKHTRSRSAVNFFWYFAQKNSCVFPVMRANNSHAAMTRRNSKQDGKMTQKELDEVLRLHLLWLDCANDGARADLRWANLSGANLSGANLRAANLRGANLRAADLRAANLRDANLRAADLRDANLSGANLRDANLRAADLRDANLSGANLRAADLRAADLSGADLSWANLSGADLRCFGDMTYIKTMQIEKWEIGYSSDELQIGCTRHSIARWREWDTETGLEWIANMDSLALESAVRFLPLLLKIITASPAQPTGYEVKNGQED